MLHQINPSQLSISFVGPRVDEPAGRSASVPLICAIAKLGVPSPRFLVLTYLWSSTWSPCGRLSPRLAR